MNLQTASGSRPMLALASVLCLHAAAAGAETIETSYQYSVKAVCSLLGTFGDGAMAQGTYRTLINVGNPTDAAVAFAVIPVVAGSWAKVPAVSTE